MLFLVEVARPSHLILARGSMSQPPVSEVGLDWIAALVVLWVGGAAWTTAVASHLGLSEWKWFGLALLTGPLAWVAVYVRLRTARHRTTSARPSGTAAPAEPAPPPE